MLLVAIQARFTVTEDGEVATYTVSRAHINMWEGALFTRTAAVVQEVETERRTFRCWIMRKVASFGGVGAVVLQKVPTDGYL